MEVNVEQFVEQFVSLTIKQAAEVAKILEEKHGIKPAAVAVAGPAAGAGGAAAPAAEAQTEFTVILATSGANKIGVIKAIRELTSLGLKEAKDLVDGAPKEIKAGVNKEESETIKKKIVEAGGTVEIK